MSSTESELTARWGGPGVLRHAKLGVHRKIMVSTFNLFVSFRAQLHVHLTPSDLGHHFSEHLVQLCFERAGHADAVRLTQLT